MAYKSITDVNKILEEYVDDIQEVITDSSNIVAEEGKNKLKNEKGTYQVRTGRYNKGWKVKKVKGDRYVSNTIYNATEYRLTHLLENGHAKRNGGRTRAFKHIAPVDEYCVKTFEKEVENAIKKGGK